jgi:DNA-binding LacI/PurR family transcriptional regulator
VGVSLLSQPALTTVRQSVNEMCDTIAAIVRQALEKPEAANDFVVRRFKPSLVVRDSSPEPSAS